MKHSCPDIFKKIVWETLCAISEIVLFLTLFQNTETICKCRVGVQNINCLENLFMLLDLCINCRRTNKVLLTSAAKQ